MAIIFVEDESITIRELLAKIATGDRVVIRHDGKAIAEVNAVPKPKDDDADGDGDSA